MQRMYKNIIQGINERGVVEGELAEAAEGERKLGVEVKRGGGKAAEGGWELGCEEELEGKLGFAAAAFGDDFCNGVARDAAMEEPVEDWAADGAFLGASWEALQKGFRIHRISKFQCLGAKLKEDTRA